MTKKNSFFIKRDEIRKLILEIGKEKWENFEVSDLEKKGNQYRCEVTADRRTASLDFYFKKDGTTTITAPGNIDIAIIIKSILEERCAYSNKEVGRTVTFKNLTNEWSNRLIEYLKSVADNCVFQMKKTRNMGCISFKVNLENG